MEIFRERWFTHPSWHLPLQQVCSVRSAEAYLSNQLVTRFGTTLSTSPGPSVSFEMKFPTVLVKKISNCKPCPSTFDIGLWRIPKSVYVYFFSGCFVCYGIKTAYIWSTIRVFDLTRRSSLTEVSFRRFPNDIRWRFTVFGTVKKPWDPPGVGEGEGNLST